MGRGARLSVVGLVLAAGSSTRFGGGTSKLLAPWRGRPLIEHVLATVVLAQAERLLADVVVVHAPATAEIGALAAKAGCDAVMVTRERPAISESIKAGFVALEAMHDLTGVTGAVVMLGDQPLLPIQAIRAIAAAGQSKNALVRPQYLGAPDAPGHPVLIGRAHWRLVGEAQGDRGLDQVIRQHGLDWTLVDVAGTNPDVDTREDLAGLDDAESPGPA